MKHRKTIIKSNFSVSLCLINETLHNIFTPIIILITIFILQTKLIYPQIPPYYNYKTAEGLASATVFQILQDKEGFIWLVTQNGASRFDGKHFTTYTVEDGFNSNVITSIAVGANGEIFFGNYEKGINVFRNGKVENYFGDSIGKNDYITFMINVGYEKKHNKLLINTRGSYVNVIEENNSGRILNNIIYFEPFTLNKIEVLPGNRIIGLTKKGIFEVKNNVPIKLNIEGYSNMEANCLADGANEGFYIGSKGKIYQIKNNRVLNIYEINVGGNDEVSNLIRDKNGNLWFSVMNKGFFKIEKGTKKIIDIGKKLELETTNVNHLFEDNEGNIWVATYGKGVYCLNNFYITNFSEKDGLSNNSIHSITKDKAGKIFFGTYNGVNIFENGKFEHLRGNPESTLTEYIFSIKIYNDGVYIGGGFPNIDRKRVFDKGYNLIFYNRQSFIKTSYGMYIYGSIGNNLGIQKNFFANRFSFQQFFIFGDSQINNRINELFEDSQKNIWVATTLGLCKLSNYRIKGGIADWDKTFFQSNPVLSARMRYIFQDKKNNIWFAGDKGIAKYNLLNDSVMTYTILDGYNLSSSTSISEDSKNRIWIGNMKGLYMIDNDSIVHLNSKSGLPTDEVLSLFYDEEKNILYVGTSSGISLLDINSFDEFHPRPPEIRLISIQAGDSVYSSNNNLIFEPEANNIYIKFAGLNFSSPDAIRYKYKLNNEWIETDLNFLNFTSLKSGIYNIEISAKSQNSSWSKPITVSFTLLPRFVETVWFIFFIFGLLLIIVLVIVLWWIKILSKKNRDKLELSERINGLKHQALSAMMNPHFIFNSLNSVQYLVNSKKNYEANNYISVMAKLIRKNLDTAGSGFILLSEEINRLRLYLELEKLRFQERFTYEIILGGDVKIDSLMIPNMIIQPFVENSLWHGIINSSSKGHLTISFLFENVEMDSISCKSLIIKVTDDGIGIKQAQENKKEDHISRGIQIIEERLKLLSAKMGLPKPIIIEDLSERNINSHGTEVIISLSPSMYKSISNN